VRKWLLYRAAVDFFFLQNRRYPRTAALGWVGDRYQLQHPERQLLHRGVFGQMQTLKRRGKRSQGEQWQQAKLVVDGHNVQITVESALLGRPLLLANDGALRDIAGQSSGFNLTRVSAMALQAILRFLAEFRPLEVLFLFDAPMSHSGLLARQYRRQMSTWGLVGGARTAPVPERELPYTESVVASSDQAVLDASRQWLDLARRVIDHAELGRPLIDFSSLVLSTPVERNFPMDLP
jgi:hypothetical protein